MSENKSTAHSLSKRVVHLQAGALALTCGIFSGLGIFAMTAWLLIKGGPEIGPHLALLSQYFYGYSVTWGGAFVGLAYGILFGALVGWVIGSIYNLVARARHGS